MSGSDETADTAHQCRGHRYLRACGSFLFFSGLNPDWPGHILTQEFRWEVFKMDLKDSWHIFLFAIQLPCKVAACISEHAH